MKDVDKSVGTCRTEISQQNKSVRMEEESMHEFQGWGFVRSSQRGDLRQFPFQNGTNSVNFKSIETGFE